MILLTEENPEPNQLYAVPEFPFECLIYDDAISYEEVQEQVVEIFLSILFSIKNLRDENRNLVTINIY
ncbi:MAG: hypothetical protein ACFFDW_03340 [Candidatus Thorarchaeota archaeon]